MDSAPRRKVHRPRTLVNIDAMSPLQRWTYAIKPASWPKLLVPCALGQGLAFFADPHAFTLAPAAFALAFTLLDGLFIVLLNDWGDQRIDALKRSLFPDGCSPKTLPDGILPPSSLLLAGLAAGALALLAALTAETLLPRPGLTLAAALALLIFVAYTLPPLRLNYRGGGEALEALGVGVVLPGLGVFAQLGHLPLSAAAFLPGFTLLAAASALASTLADETSDRQGGKRTAATLLGNPTTRRAAEAALLLGAAAWPLAAALLDLHTLPAALLAAAATLAFWRPLRRVSPLATTDAFDPQRLYKLHLHRAILAGALTLAIALTLTALLTSTPTLDPIAP